MTDSPSLPDRSPPPDAVPPAEGSSGAAASRPNRRGSAEAPAKTRRAPGSQKRTSPVEPASAGRAKTAARAPSRPTSAKTTKPMEADEGTPVSPPRRSARSGTKTPPKTPPKATPKATPKTAPKTAVTSATSKPRRPRTASAATTTRSQPPVARTDDETPWEPRRLIPLVSPGVEGDDGPKRLLPARALAPVLAEGPAAAPRLGYGILDMPALFATEAWESDEAESGPASAFDEAAPAWSASTAAPETDPPSPWARPSAAPSVLTRAHASPPVPPQESVGSPAPQMREGLTPPASSVPLSTAGSQTGRLPFDGSFHDQPASPAPKPSVREFFTVLALAAWRPVRRLGQVGVGLAMVCAIMGLIALGLFTWRHLTPTDLAAHVMAIVSPSSRVSPPAAGAPPPAPPTARSVVELGADAPRVAQGYLLTLHTYDQTSERTQYQRAQRFLADPSRIPPSGAPSGLVRDGTATGDRDSVPASRRLGAGVRRSLVVEQVRTAHDAPQASWVVNLRGYVLEMTSVATTTPADIRGPRAVDFVVRLGRCAHTDSLCVRSATPDPWAADVNVSTLDAPSTPPRAPSPVVLPLPALRRDTLAGPRSPSASRATRPAASGRVGAPASTRSGSSESPRTARPEGEPLSGPPPLRPLSPSLPRPTAAKPPEGARPKTSAPLGASPPVARPSATDSVTSGRSPRGSAPVELPGARLPSDPRPVSPALETTKERILPDVPQVRPRTVLPGMLPPVPDVLGATGDAPPGMPAPTRGLA